MFSVLQLDYHRVHTRQGKVREKFFFSRSGNCQGILQNVREILKFGKCQGNVREFSDLGRHQFVKVKAVSSNISFFMKAIITLTAI